MGARPLLILSLFLTLAAMWKGNESMAYVQQGGMPFATRAIVVVLLAVASAVSWRSYFRARARGGPGNRP